MISIPYGNARLKMEERGVREVLESRVREMGGTGDGDKLVLDAMASPIGSPALEELARGKKTATLIVSDHTRPVPSRHIVPFMLRALRRGSPDIDVTLLVATGCHRGTRKEELISKLGKRIVYEEKIAVHDCDESEFLSLGRLPSGAELVINRLAAETDLLLAEGFIEPHFFAGFSGGRKSVLPGICSRAAVMANHCSAFIDSPFARAGVLENNPIHRDMAAAAEMAGLAYIVNVIINENREIAAAFAGSPAAAHERGCAFLSPFCRVAPRRRSDIVVTSNGGAPLDQNIYQAVKGLCAAEAAAREGGVIVICAECADGTGGESFYRAMRDCADPADLLARVRAVPREETAADQWQYQILARILAKNRVLFVTDPRLERTIAEMKMEYAPTLGRALELARAYAGSDDIIVIPDGVSVVVDAGEPEGGG